MPRPLFRNGRVFAPFFGQVFAGLFDKAYQRTKRLLASLVCIVALASAVLVAINCFDGPIDVDAGPVKLEITKLPDGFAKNTHHF